MAFTYRTCCWAGACECHHVIHSYFNIRSIRSRPLYWRKYSSSGHTATWWNLLYHPQQRRNTLDRHWLRHKSLCSKGWNIQQSRLLWRSDSKCRRPHFGRASNFWQPDVFWRHPSWAFCWPCHWWRAHNRLRSKAAEKSLVLINIPGQETSGRYVIVQMDNGGDQLNLQEVKAFGRATTSSFHPSTHGIFLSSCYFVIVSFCHLVSLAACKLLSFSALQLLLSFKQFSTAPSSAATSGTDATTATG